MNTELEAFIVQLKRDGCSKVASIVKVAQSYKLGMDAAKKAVHESPAWEPEKTAHEEFQEKLEDALNDVAPTPTPDSARDAHRPGRG